MIRPHGRAGWDERSILTHSLSVGQIRTFAESRKNVNYLIACRHDSDLGFFHGSRPLRADAVIIKSGLVAEWSGKCDFYADY